MPAIFIVNKLEISVTQDNFLSIALVLHKISLKLQTNQLIYVTLIFAELNKFVDACTHRTSLNH